MNDKPTTIEATMLEELAVNYTAGPATIGMALEKVQAFLDNVLIQALVARELHNGTQPVQFLQGIIGNIGVLAQMLKGPSQIAGAQMLPPGVRPM